MNIIEKYKATIHLAIVVYKNDKNCWKEIARNYKCSY